MTIYQQYISTLDEVLASKQKDFHLQIGPNWDLKIERAELVRELLRIISAKPQGFPVRPQNLAFVVRRVENFNQTIQVKVLPFFANRLEDFNKDEYDSDERNNLNKIDSILDNFIGNFE